jgi:hypothetical protein
MANDFFSVDEIESTRFKDFDFEGKWEASFGKPEATGVWIIYGKSFNGKSSLMMQLAKYLTGFVKNKVLINSLEEGKTKSFKMNVDRSGISTVKEKVIFGNRVTMEKLCTRLDKQRSPEIIMIDSLQYSKLNKKSFEELREKYRNKLWIFISQADKSGAPKGSLAEDIHFDADVKIEVKGFQAFPESRYGGGEVFIIDEKRAAAHSANIK